MLAQLRKQYGFISVLGALTLSMLTACAHTQPIEPATPGQSSKEPADDRETTQQEASDKALSEKKVAEAQTSQEQASGTQAENIAPKENYSADDIKAALKSA